MSKQCFVCETVDERCRPAIPILVEELVCPSCRWELVKLVWSYEPRFTKNIEAGRRFIDEYRERLRSQISEDVNRRRKKKVRRSG
jgi:hypothetical protein